MNRSGACRMLFGAIAWTLLAAPALAEPVPDKAVPTTAASAPGADRSAGAAGLPQSPGDGVRPARKAQRPRKVPSLDEQVQALTKALDLSQAQQSQLKLVLESQRDQVRHLLTDQSLPAENRSGRVRSINDNTIERIRALLNDEQRKSYYPYGPPQTPGSAQSSTMDHWQDSIPRQK